MIDWEKACLLAGVEPNFITWQGDHDTPIEFVIAKNLKRRHLTASQRAVVALDVLPHLKEVAKKRQLSKLNQGATSPVEALMPQRGNGRAKQSRTHAAELVGASARNVSDAKKISQEAPELLACVRTGKKCCYLTSDRVRLLPGGKFSTTEKFVSLFLRSGKNSLSGESALCLDSGLLKPSGKFSGRFIESQERVEVRLVSF